MTDITELAQREKFEAWAEEVGALPWGILKKHRNQDGSYPGPHYTYMWKAWQAASAELVEALEKAQQRIGDLEREQEHLRPVGVMSEKAFHRLENSESRFIALWPRPGIFLPRKRPEDGVIVYARTAAAAEKAQRMETYWKTQCRGITDHCEELQARIAELESRTVTAAAADVLAERKRQVTTEGWTPEHDDQHVNFEMAIAGGLYAISAVDSHHKLRNSAPSAWPWDRKWWKPDGPRRDLVKAGALILAEIERLDRAAGIKVEAE
ncbi:hypothetical protein ABN147_07405 [Klebsiella oxytoca]|uniref:hypothetical protein n=1 Tax=Klebsiella oxytoca TaxID=571 RepID=UPI0032DB0A84